MRIVEIPRLAVAVTVLILQSVSACGPNSLASQAASPQDGPPSLNEELLNRRLDILAPDYRAGENTQHIYASSVDLMDAWTQALREVLPPFEDTDTYTAATWSQLSASGYASGSGISWAQKQRITKIRRYLRGVQRWIRIFEPDTAEIGRVRADLWDSLYESAEGATTDVGGDLSLDRRLQAPRDLLLALFGEGDAPELDASLFVWLVGDSLDFLMQRIDGLTPYVDVARLYLGTSDASSSLSPLDDVWRLLSTVDDPDGLQETPALDDWTPVFEAMRSDHTRLVDALAPIAKDHAVGYKRLDILQTQQSLPRQYHELASVIATANERVTRTRDGGLFLDAPQRGIKNNLLAVSREALAQDLDEKLASLNTQITIYETNIDTLLRELISSSAYTIAKERLEGESRSTNANLTTLSNAKEGKISRLASLDQDFHVQISNALTSLDSSSGYLRLETLNTANVSASDAQFVPDGKPDDDWTASDVAVMGPFHVPAGGILEVTIPPSSRWSPDCAISKEYPLSSAPPTGPEGYAMTEKFGSQLVVSASLVSGTQSGETSYIGSSVGVTSSSSWGKEASFRSGVFSERVPIREAPAGSLALISYVGHQAESLRLRDRASSQVITAPRFTAVAEYNMTYFLVVNDERCPDASGTPLAVTVSRWIAATEIMKHEVGSLLMQKIAAAVETIRAERHNVMLTGELLPETQRRLRSSTSWEIDSDPVVGQLFDRGDIEQIYNLVVDTEIERLVLEGEIYSLGRQIEQQQAAAHLLARQIEDAEYSQSLQELLVKNVRARLHRGVLESAAVASARLFRDGFASIVDVWYPEIRDQFAAKSMARDVLNAGVHWSLPDLARKTAWMLQDVTATYRTRIRDNTLEQWDKAVVVGIPQPGATTVPMAEGPNMAQDQATAFWSALHNGSDVAISIGADLLYATDVPHHQLVCSDSYPVVHRMALVLVARRDSEIANNAATFNGLEITEEVAAQETQTVIGADAGVYVHFLNPSRLKFPVGVLFAQADGEALDLVRDKARIAPQRLGHRAIGVSPYGDIEFHFSKLSPWGWRETQWQNDRWSRMYLGAYLVMLVETHEEHREISWLPMCSE